MSLGVGFEVSNGQARPIGTLFLQLADPDVELSSTPPVPYLSVCHIAFCHSNKGLNL